MDVRQFSSDKILKHIDRVNDWLSGCNPPPITVEIDMTNLCNHKCPECVSSYFRMPDASSLSKELSSRIIGELKEAKIRGLIFTGGGEPLCNVYTIGAVELAKGFGLDIGFITNGALLDKDAGRTLLNCCTWIRISVDASDEVMFQKTHGMNGKEFKLILENVKELANIKRQTGSSCTIGVGYLTSEATISGMTDAAKVCSRMNVDYIQFRPMQIHHGGKFDYHWADADKHIEECLKYSRNGYKVLFSRHKYDMMKDAKFGRNYGKCYGHQFATVISASGKMYVCCHLRGYEKYCIGDLRQNSFEEIWNSEHRKKVCEGIDFKDCIPLCRDNTFNQILWNIKEPREHVNFL